MISSSVCNKVVVKLRHEIRGDTWKFHKSSMTVTENANPNANFHRRITQSLNKIDGERAQNVGRKPRARTENGKVSR